MSTYRIRVGWSSERPFINDQHTREVAIIAPDGTAGAADARVCAANFVATLALADPYTPECHVTSATIIEQEV